MNIKTSVDIHQAYDEIAALCKSTGEPVSLTVNGAGDLVVMDIETFTHWEKMLKLREELLNIERDRSQGAPGYTVDEVSAMMEEAVKEVRQSGA